MLYFGISSSKPLALTTGQCTSTQAAVAAAAFAQFTSGLPLINVVIGYEYLIKFHSVVFMRTSPHMRKSSAKCLARAGRSVL